jgi:hypothetical protein
MYERVHTHSSTDTHGMHCHTQTHMTRPHDMQVTCTVTPRPSVPPQMLSAESPERLSWAPPTPALIADGDENDQENNEEDAPVPPPSLAELLQTPVAPGACLPTMAVRVSDMQGNMQAGEVSHLCMCVSVCMSTYICLYKMHVYSMRE